MKTVLMVEDNEDDAFLLRMACQRSGIPHSLQLVMDGKTAIDYISGAGIYADRTAHPFPDMVFLDLKLPVLHGFEVLAWIREDAKLKNLPVVVLTSSEEPRDVSRAYSLGVTSYLRKISEPVEFGQAVRIVLKYWLVLNTVVE